MAKQNHDTAYLHDTAYTIEMLGISKTFLGTPALDNVFLNVKPGEIHAVLGENGAGKTTLMNIDFGLYQPDAGIIKKDGKEVKIDNPNIANALGIGMVHQHFKLVDIFSVLDNIILGEEPTKLGFLQRYKARKKIKELSSSYGLRVDPDAIIENITVGMQQRVEILKMLYRNNSILILDEPTANLTPQETEELLKIMKKLASQGKSIIFISHKLEEIMTVADSVTVLRKGKSIGTVQIKDTTKEELASMMCGTKVNFHVAKKESEAGNTVLKVRELTVASNVHQNNAVKDVSFDVHKNEIVAIAGVDGNGQKELVDAITGLVPIVSGHIYLNNKDITQESVRQRIKNGISHIPADRHKDGLVLDYPLDYNLVLQRYSESEFCNKFGFMKRENIRKYSQKLIEQYDIRCGQGSNTIMRSMSGGNQQKAIIARESDKDHCLMIAVQPTRGLDVGATEFVHKKLVALRDSGKAVLLVSLDLDEVMDLADRILVMYEGKIVGEFDPKHTTPEELGLYMSGARRNEVIVE
jgi:simple sugar transport system ATP-binding protein